MYQDFNLSARERGYCTPGKKLRPRCSFDAMDRDFGKHRSMRELRKVRTLESIAMGEPEGIAEHIAPHWRKANKAMDALSARRRKRVERLLEGGVVEELGRAMARAYAAMIEADQIERCMQADERMLANAY